MRLVLFLSGCAGVAAAILAAPSARAEEAINRGPPRVVVEKTTVDGVERSNLFIAGAGAFRPTLDGLAQVLDTGAGANASFLNAFQRNPDGAPSPYLTALAVFAGAPQPRAYWGARALYQMTYDARRCPEDAAGRYPVEAAILVVGSRIDAVQAAMDDPASMCPALDRLLADPAIPSDRADPWWACSASPAPVAALMGLQGEADGVPSGFDPAQWARPRSEWPAIRDRVRADIAAQRERLCGR